MKGRTNADHRMTGCSTVVQDTWSGRSRDLDVE